MPHTLEQKASGCSSSTKLEERFVSHIVRKFTVEKLITDVLGRDSVFIFLALQNTSVVGWGID